MAGRQNDKRALRVMLFLRKRECKLHKTSSNNQLLLDAGDFGAITEEISFLMQLVSEGLISLTKNRSLRLTKSGEDLLYLRKTSNEQGFAAASQSADYVTRTITAHGEQETVIVNNAESPLALLARRKNKNGARFLTSGEFRAGERLRRDYTQGQLMPSMGINWSSFGRSGGRRSCDSNGVAELTDAALSARQRVELAVEAVGPELSGVLIDVCCFLKGLERVEAERAWPARSAKIVLKSALSVLARYYEPQNTRKMVKSEILHWGSADYRPRFM